MDDALKDRGSSGAQRDHADDKRESEKHLLFAAQSELKRLLKHD